MMGKHDIKRGKLRQIGRGLFLVFWMTVAIVPAMQAQQTKAAAEAAKKKQTLKHRRDIQTKETRERMDAVDRRAREFNEQNKLKWWQRIFKRRSHRK
jgi:hypothetical protein